MLLLDEPLGALDLKLRQEMQIELKRIQREVGITFVYVTHDQEEALTMSDRMAVINQGRIEQLGTPIEVYERPATEFVAGFIGVSNLLDRDGRRFTVRPEKIRLLADGEPAPDRHPRRAGRIDEVVYLGMLTRYWSPSMAAASSSRCARTWKPRPPTRSKPAGGQCASPGATTRPTRSTTRPRVPPARSERDEPHEEMGTRDGIAARGRFRRRAGRGLRLVCGSSHQQYQRAVPAGPHAAAGEAAGADLDRRRARAS